MLEQYGVIQCEKFLVTFGASTMSNHSHVVSVNCSVCVYIQMVFGVWEHH